MKLTRYIITLGLGAMCLSQTANACQFFSSMQPHDYAFADIIFDGEIKQTFPEVRYNKYSKKDQVVSAEFLFSVDNVLRGDLPKPEILVGFNGHTFGIPGSVETFVERYGKHVRVGLITPTQYETFCREEQVERTLGNGRILKQKNVVCDFDSPRHLTRVKDIPFIQTASCANQFIFDTSKPMSLPRDNGTGYHANLIRIFRNYTALFTPDLTSDSPDMDVLVKEGVKHHKISKIKYLKTNKGRLEYTKRAEQRLRERFLVLAKLSETDPGLRERFLRDDLSNIDR